MFVIITTALMTDDSDTDGKRTVVYRFIIVCCIDYSTIFVFVNDNSCGGPKEFSFGGSHNLAQNRGIEMCILLLSSLL